MLEGNAPYTKQLADNYAFSDNYHQPAMGGTGLDSIILFFGDAIWFKDQNGNLVPPHNQQTFLGGPVDEIENPNPVPGTNNYWIQDGYGGFGSNGQAGQSGVYGGGSYTNCSDTSLPGVGPIVTYLSSLKPAINPNCEEGHYYLLNNYNRVISVMGATPTRTQTPATHRSRFPQPRSVALATFCWKTTSPGRATTINGIAILAISISSTMERLARRATSTATSATDFTTRRR
jgi:hypothetical protein